MLSLKMMVMKIMTTSFNNRTPNYAHAEIQAYKILIENGITELPVSVTKIIKKFKNLKIKKYSTIAKKYGTSVDEVSTLYDSNDACCTYRKTHNQYLIAYNDTIKSKQRIRFSLAHELGHYILKHNEITHKTSFARNSLSDADYQIFELEANCFARALLAPPIILKDFENFTPRIIEEVCGLSKQASSLTYEFIQNTYLPKKIYEIAYSASHFDIKRKISDTFNDFKFRINHSYYCKNCQGIFKGEHVQYCIYCGKPNISKLINLNKRKSELKKMIYDGILLNESNKALQCPRCQNENILEEGEYCHICGLNVFNYCTDNNPYISCGICLPGDARYCFNCGSPSSFLLDEVLLPYNNEERTQ